MLDFIIGMIFGMLLLCLIVPNNKDEIPTTKPKQEITVKEVLPSPIVQPLSYFPEGVIIQEKGQVLRIGFRSCDGIPVVISYKLTGAAI